MKLTVPELKEAIKVGYYNNDFLLYLLFSLQKKGIAVPTGSKSVLAQLLNKTIIIESSDNNNNNETEEATINGKRKDKEDGEEEKELSTARYIHLFLVVIN